MGLDMYLEMYDTPNESFIKDKKIQIGFWRKFYPLNTLILESLFSMPDANYKEIELSQMNIEVVLKLFGTAYNAMKIENPKLITEIDKRVELMLDFNEILEDMNKLFSKSTTDKVKSALPVEVADTWGEQFNGWDAYNIIQTIKYFEKAHKLMVEEGQKIYYLAWW